MTTTPPAAALPSIVTRTEWVWLGISLVLGAALRLGNLSQVAVEHFDEAVYASNLLFPPEAGGEYPFRQLYAPPLLPAAIEWTTILGQALPGGVPDWWPMLPGLVCGLATIPSAWWIGRRWFSPRAGIIAALLIAGNEYHAAYSRTALTDVPLSLFILWAVHWFWRGLQSGTTRDAVVAGGFTALAWWTKYNGWLPLAIAGAGGIAWQIVTPAGERNWSRLVRVWIIGAATAVILWLPVVWDCQQVGGYSAVAANHRRYIDGFAKSGNNLWRGMASLDRFFGAGGAASLLILMGGWVVLPRDAAGDRRPMDAGSRVALCLVAAWFWGLLVSTTLYFPYPRLWEPWLLSGCLVLAASFPFAGLLRLGNRDGVVRSLAAWTGVAFVLMMGIGFVGRGPIRAGLPVCLESRLSSLAAARRIEETVGDPHSPIFVHSDPAIWYHLRQRDQAAIIADGLSFLNQPLPSAAWLVVGPQSARELERSDEWVRVESRLELTGEIVIEPSLIVLLDSFSPRELANHPERRTMAVRLYRVRP